MKVPYTSMGNDYFLPDATTRNYYYPFGMERPGMTATITGKDYRFGYNGKENDRDWQKQDYGFRTYDPRVARFLSLDPLKKQYPWYSPFQFAGNTPIQAIDLDGAEPLPITFRWFMGQESFKPELRKTNSNMILAGQIAGGACALAVVAVTAPEALPALARFAPAMFRAGAVSGSVNATISMAQGESMDNITRSFVSGLIGGSVLGIGTATTIPMLATQGAMSGAIGNYVDQVIKTEFQGEKGDYSLQNAVASAGVGAVANTVSGKIVKAIQNYVDTKVVSELTKINGEEYFNSIKNSIKKDFPSLSNKQLNKETNKVLGEIKELTIKQGEQLKSAMTTIIERNLDYIENRIENTLQTDTPTTGE